MNIINKKILVTGGAGFLGSSIAERLTDDNEIILIDKLFKGNAYEYTKLKDNKNVTIIEGDILKYNLLKQVIKNVDIIIHCAAIVGVEKVRSMPIDTLDINYIGTSNLLKAIDENNCKLSRFIYFSTSEVFGSNAFQVTEDDITSFGTVNEARWAYSISKIAGEHLTYAYYKKIGLPAVIIRPFNIFGPKRIGKNAITVFILNAIKNEPITIFQDGSQIRSWCYIDDFVDAIIKCLENDNAIGQSFNIGNPNNTLTIYDLAKRVKSLCSSNSEIKFRDIEYSDIDIRVPSIAKLKKLLNFSPKYDLEEGILLAKEWYENNPVTLI